MRGWERAYDEGLLQLLKRRLLGSSQLHPPAFFNLGFSITRAAFSSSPPILLLPLLSPLFKGQRLQPLAVHRPLEEKNALYCEGQGAEEAWWEGDEIADTLFVLSVVGTCAISLVR